MWWRREKKEVAEFLYALLVANPPKGYARKVAERMQVPYPTLSKYWLGKTRFPAALVGPLFLATDQDPTVADFFLLQGSDYRLERRPDSELLGDLPRAIMELSRLEGRITELYLRATVEDGQDLGHAESKDLRAAVLSLVTHAENLRAALSPGDSP